MSSLKNPTVVQSAHSDEELTDMRVEYWLKSFEMLADHPFGTGARGYDFLSPYYMPEEWLSKGRRSVHSTWFEILTDFGYQGIVLYILYLLFGFLELRKTRVALRARGDDFRVYQSFALEAALIAFMIPASFISSFFVEFGYWPMMFIAMFYNINYLQPQGVPVATPPPQVLP